MKRNIFITVFLILSLSISACGKKEYTDVQVGDKIYGFTLNSVGHSSSLNAEVYSFYHEYSGANLVYIENDDPEVAFNIYYHVPMVDETDTNHVFENSIMTSSKKYPSQDLFHDVSNKSFNTYVNSAADIMMSGYMLSSLSEEQLLKLVDVCLSCMVAPDILTNENIFKREGVRYQLYDEDSDIQMLGNILSEDIATETSVEWNHINNVLDTLYTGEYASNFLGRSNYEYKRLTYEHALATFDRCYHFDNSIMLLYGDLDYKNFLKFINKEYLSKQKKYGTDLSIYKDDISPAGFKDIVYNSPAHVGDDVSNATKISYVIDLSDLDWDTILKLDVLGNAEESVYGVFNQTLIEHGIYDHGGIEVNFYSAKPYIDFYLENTMVSQKENFYKAVLDTINRLSTQGEDSELLYSMIKTKELASYMVREQQNVGVNIAPSFAMWWMHTDKTDYLQAYEKNIEEYADNPNEITKEIASKLINPRNSAIVATVPTHGLAEMLEDERASYLRHMKDNLTKEELKQFIADSIKFDEWNQKEKTNDDFLIAVDKLPEMPEDVINIHDEKNGNLRILSIPEEIEKVGQYRLFLDTSAITNEDKYYLLLLVDMSGSFNTDIYKADEIEKVGYLYLDSCVNSYQYICDENGNKYPTMAIRWNSFTEDFEKSIELLKEMFLHSDFNEPDILKYYINYYKESYNPQKSNPDDLAYQYASLGTEYLKETTLFELELYEGYYRFLQEMERKLVVYPDYAEEINNRLHAVAEKIFVNGKNVLTISANQEGIARVAEYAAMEINSWPEQTVTESSLVLPESSSKSKAVILDSSDTYGYLVSDEVEKLEGRYAPFIMLLGDQYITQKIIVENGVYGASAVPSYRCKPGIVMWSYADNNINRSIEIFKKSKEFLESKEITQKELNGYILSAYSELTESYGILGDNTISMTRYLSGLNIKDKIDFINDIKNAKVSDKEAAIKEIGLMIDNATLGVAGNENIIKKAADKFEEVVSYR